MDLAKEEVEWLLWYHYARPTLVVDKPDWFNPNTDYKRFALEQLLKLLSADQQILPKLSVNAVPGMANGSSDKFTTINATQPGNFSLTINVTR